MIAAALVVTTSAVRVSNADSPDGGADGGIPHPTKPEVKKPDAGTITVPASVVAKIIEKRDVSAVNATSADGAPLGAKLIGVGKYKSGLRDGDIITMVSGTRTTTVDAVVGAGMRVVMSGGTQMTGKILRGTSTYAVVLELPK